jgi:LacI family transcriptional regulator
MNTGRRIGLAIDAVAGYGRGVIRGIMSFCRRNPRWVITVEPSWSFARVPDIDKWEADGLIVQIPNRKFEDHVLRRGLPATNVSNVCMGPARIPTVVPDDLAVGTMGADYLISLGFRDLGFCWSGDSLYGRLRFGAFSARAKEAGVTVHECQATKQDLGKWLVELPKPIGVLGGNDDWAHRVLNAAHRNGIKVPDEMAVMGVDDDELFNTLVTPSLSSIAIPAEQVGFEAAALLDRIMDGKKQPADPILLPPVRIVARESTDVINIDDAEVVQAVRFIRNRSSEPLQVDDVMDHVPLSRRSLERKFRTLVGHSISDEIRRAHIERAKHLLLTTDMAMPQIAAASGFTSATRLGIVFLREVGQPPTEYRRRVRAGGALRKPKTDEDLEPLVSAPASPKQAEARKRPEHTRLGNQRSQRRR